MSYENNQDHMEEISIFQVMLSTTPFDAVIDAYADPKSGRDTKLGGLTLIAFVFVGIIVLAVSMFTGVLASMWGIAVGLIAFGIFHRQIMFYIVGISVWLASHKPFPFFFGLTALWAILFFFGLNADASGLVFFSAVFALFNFAMGCIAGVIKGIKSFVTVDAPAGAFANETYDTNMTNTEQSVREGLITVLIDYYAPVSVFRLTHPSRREYGSEEAYLQAVKTAEDKRDVDRMEETDRHIESVTEGEGGVIQAVLRTKRGGTDIELVRYAPAIDAALATYGVEEYDHDERAGYVGFTVYTIKTASGIETLMSNPIDADFFVHNPCEDMFDVPLAVDAFGNVINLPIHHTLIAGVTGSGKGSPIQGLIRQYAPYVKQRTIRLWGIDPKIAEFKPYRGTTLFHRLAFDSGDIAALIHEVWGEMKAAQVLVGRQGSVTTETPMNILFADEFVAVVNDKSIMNDKDNNGITASKKLYDIMAQGRSSNFFFIAATQEVIASVLGQFRTNFSNKIALRLNTSGHVEIVLGKGAVSDGGASAHRIPRANRKNNSKSSGIANLMEEDGSIALIRFAYTSDDDIDALIKEFTVDSEEYEVAQVALAAEQEALEEEEEFAAVDEALSMFADEGTL